MDEDNFRSDKFWMVTAIIHPFKLDSVTLAAEAIPWLNGMTVTKCVGLTHAPASGELREQLADETDVGGTADIDRNRRLERAADAVGDFTDKLRIEIAVSSREQADEIASVIAGAARTGRKGDGKIFITPIVFAGQIRSMGKPR